MAIVLGLVGQAAAADKVPEAAYARVNAAIVENHIVPRYAALADATRALAQSAGFYCAEPGEGRLAELRNRFHAAMDAWMGVQHLRFGPIELAMRASRIYFWPEARNRIGEAVEDLLAGDPSRIAPDALIAASVAAQGLPAVEYLVFGDGGAARLQGRRCELLASVTASVSDMASGARDGWRTGQPPYARVLAEPGRHGGEFATHQDVALALFKSFHNELLLIADVKLKPPLGEAIGSAKPRLVESRRSARAMRNIVANLSALQALYLGDGGPGLSDIVREHGGDAPLDPLMRRAFAQTLDTARAIGLPLQAAVTDSGQRPLVEKLLTQVLALKQIVRTRVASALDLAVGFNALDGD